MENSFQTSFIPKKPIDTASMHIRGDEKPPKNYFKIFAFILFIISIIISGVVYFYSSYLSKQKDNLSSNLEQIKNGFDENTINELEIFSNKLNISKDILDSHSTVSPLLDSIAGVVIPAVWFNKFDYEFNDKGLAVKLSGISSDFKSIAIQAESFSGEKGRMFKNVIFSNINKNDNNTVSFDVEFSVDQSLLSYGSGLSKISGSNILENN